MELKDESFIIRWEREVGGAYTFRAVGIFLFCNLLVRSNTNNPWSRGSYIFRHKCVCVCVCGGGGGQTSVFMGKCLSFRGRGFAHRPPPPPSLTHTFSVSVFQDLENPKLPFLNQGQDFIIFFSGCFCLTANLFIDNMVLVQKYSCSILGWHLISKAWLLVS